MDKKVSGDKFKWVLITFFIIYVLFSIFALSRNKVLLAEAELIETASNKYYSDNGSWPTSDEKLSLSEDLSASKNEYVDLDEDLLIAEGYVEADSVKSDFGVVNSGPEEGTVFSVKTYKNGSKKVIGD